MLDKKKNVEKLLSIIKRELNNPDFEPSESEPTPSEFDSFESDIDMKKKD